MKDISEQHGREANRPPKGKKYSDWFEQVSQRPTFSDPGRERNKAGSRIAGFDRPWGNVNRIDPKTGQPMSHATAPNMPAEATKRSHSAAVTYSGKDLRNPTNRVPDAGKDWTASKAPGTGFEPGNDGGFQAHQHTGKDPILRWQDRNYDISDLASAVAPAKTGRGRTSKSMKS